MARIGVASLACLLWALALPLAAQPLRVVSMNVCTDQLALQLAAPGQLISVSYLTRDPRVSAMVEEAQAVEVNHGFAEEIYLLEPDLVIAGTFSTRATVDMLRRLGLPVVVMEPAWSLADVGARITEMGGYLGREAEAAALRARFEADLALLGAQGGDGPRAALYSEGGWTQGDASLAGQILSAAGLRNIAPELGYGRGGVLPLELLVMAAPDMVISPAPQDGQSAASALLMHPVMQHLRADQARSYMRDSDWVCGTPHVLRAIARLTEDRRNWEALRP